MPGTPTTKYSIPTFNAAGSDPVNTGHTQINSALSAVDANMAGYTTGTLAARPAAAKAGLTYRCTDTGQVFLDTGSAWVEVARLTTAMGAYKTISEASITLQSINTGATTYLPTWASGAVALGSFGGFPILLPLTLADYAVTGLTTQFRVQATTMTNSVAPGVNFTFAVQQVTGVGGTANQSGVTTLAAPPPAVTRTSPAANSTFVDSTVDFSLSVSGAYVLIVAASATPASGSVNNFAVRLQYHHI